MLKPLIQVFFMLWMLTTLISCTSDEDQPFKSHGTYKMADISVHQKIIDELNKQHIKYRLSDDGYIKYSMYDYHLHLRITREALDGDKSRENDLESTFFSSEKHKSFLIKELDRINIWYQISTNSQGRESVMWGAPDSPKLDLIRRNAMLYRLGMEIPKEDEQHMQ
ncbi:hypothetical protein [Aliamphritea ceti]|uniref:hypothetical protein n=1 Tax=Aliamphritea ceti TaxID=1524258 RepID=UPI0021C3F81F|nr:hypothetical protein [Aliamphritea ceti]